MQIYRKQLVDIFTKVVLKNYSEHCLRHGIPENNHTFLNFLFTKNLLREVAVRHFTISTEFKKTYDKSKSTKTQTVRLLADKYNMTERAVWNIIKTRSK